MTKEKVLYKNLGDSTRSMLSDSDIYSAMDKWAKIQAIEFFKWYGVKMMGFIDYIKDTRPMVESLEIEEKIKEFEGKDFGTLYELFLQSQNKQ